MLLAVRCNKESFKEVHFQQGLNVILAERTKDATKRDSRNGLGKSSLIQIIHFCLGANISKTLSNSALEDWTFTLDLQLKGKDYSVSRNTKERGKVIIEGDFTDWLIKPEIDKTTSQYVMSVRDWTKVLGSLMFDMQLNYQDMEYAPTFRSCISYLIRQGGDGGFLTPFSQYKQQKEWDIQVNNAFLIGLDWTYASKWQVLKDRNKILRQLKIEAETGILKEMEGSIGELEAKRITLRSRIDQQNKELSDYNVHPQYKRIESDANKYTEYIHELVNENMSDGNLLEFYENSLKEERGADITKVKKMYEEAGASLSDSIKKRLEDVEDFHKKIVINRKDFIISELTRLKQKISERQLLIQNSNEKRTELFNILKTHKALEEYTRLQQNNLTVISELKDIERKLDNLKKFEQGKSALKIDLELIQQNARIALSEKNKEKETAINYFNSNSQALYQSPGTLSINVLPKGYSFDVMIERAESYGVNNMKIFCYDLMLAQLWSNKLVSPGILIHDSLLFADVDERQVANAIQLASKESRERKFQYICTLNSDSIPKNDFSKDFKFSDYVRLTLTDDKEEGCLFGVRF